MVFKIKNSKDGIIYRPEIAENWIRKLDFGTKKFAQKLTEEKKKLKIVKEHLRGGRATTL